MPKSMTIIIPCFNEEENIKPCIQRIPVFSFKTEIIAVNDGSTDKTLEKMKEIKKPNFDFISYSKNKGKGFAVRQALQKAKNDLIIILDADMATQPEEIFLVVKPLFETKADFVNTTRLKKGMREKNSINFLHVLGNKIFAFFISLLTGFPLTDSLSGFKAFKRKDFLGELKENSWMDFELIFLAKKKKLRFIEIPIHYNKRIAGKSKMKTFFHAIQMTFLLLKSFVKSF
jgi:glycosyltransferase involved in cell wall biosynthesis